MTKITLTILRPTGVTEIVDVSDKFCGMTPDLFAKIKAATKNAGKGDVKSYSVDVILTEAEKAECARMIAADKLARRIENS